MDTFTLKTDIKNINRAIQMFEDILESNEDSISSSTSQKIKLTLLTLTTSKQHLEDMLKEE